MVDFSPFVTGALTFRVRQRNGSIISFMPAGALSQRDQSAEWGEGPRAALAGDSPNARPACREADRTDERPWPLFFRTL